MPAYRSRTTTHGRNMAGARGLWRATGMKDEDFGKPIIAVVNSFTQFVPGHVHLKDLGQLVAREIEAAGGVAKEFNTIAVDDGIAMGHDGMLYSLPSRELIADSVEYMVNAHCADAMVCISNCDKITPGMLMAALRINIPVVFVSGGPMEAGKVTLNGKIQALDLVGRKLPKDGGRAVSAFFAEINGFLGENKEDEALAPYLAPVKTALGQLQQATMWLMANGMKNPDNAGAASTDYMHLFGLVALSYMWARIVKAVLKRQAAGTSTPELDAKLWLARFFNARVLPEGAAHLARISTGAEPLMGLAAEAF